MRRSGPSTFLAFLVSAGLLSAAICQCHIQTARAAAPSEHCAPEEESAPAEPCCVMQAAELGSRAPVVLAPEAAGTVVVETARAETPADRWVPRGTPTDNPPGNRPVLHQTCSLLI